MPSSPNIAPVMLVGSSVSVCVRAGDSLSASGSIAADVLVPMQFGNGVSRIPEARLIVGCWSNGTECSPSSGDVLG